MSQRGLQFEEEDTYEVAGAELPEVSLAAVDDALRGLSDNLEKPGELEQFEGLSMLNEQLLFHDALGVDAVDGYETSAGDLYNAEESGDVAMKRVAHSRDEMRLMGEFIADADRLPEVSPQQLLDELPHPDIVGWEKKMEPWVRNLTPLERKWELYKHRAAISTKKSGDKIAELVACLPSGEVAMRRVSRSPREIEAMQDFLSVADRMSEPSPEKVAKVLAKGQTGRALENALRQARGMSAMERKWTLFWEQKRGLGPRGSRGLGDFWNWLGFKGKSDEAEEPAEDGYMLKWFLQEQNPRTDAHPLDLLDVMGVDPTTETGKAALRAAWVMTPIQLQYAIFRAERTPPYYAVPQPGEGEKMLSRREEAMARIFLTIEHNLEDPSQEELDSLPGYDREIARIKEDFKRHSDRKWFNVTPRLRKWVWLNLKFPDMWRYYDTARPDNLEVPVWDATVHGRPKPLGTGDADAPVAADVADAQRAELWQLQKSSARLNVDGPEDVQFVVPVIEKYAESEGSVRDRSTSELQALARTHTGQSLTPGQVEHYRSASPDERRFAGLLLEHMGEKGTGPAFLSMLPSAGASALFDNDCCVSAGGLGTTKDRSDVGRVLVSTVRGLKKAPKLDTKALRNQKPWQYHVVNEDRWGDGPGQTRNLVVFIHGINAKEPVWTQQALGLAAKVKDTFPYAYFPHIKQHKNGKLKDYAEPVVRGILEYLQTYGTRVKKIMIVGISNGGRIALEVEWNLRAKNLQDPSFRQELERNKEGQDVMRIKLDPEVQRNPPQLFIVTVASPLGGTKSASSVPKFISRRIYGDSFLEEVEVGGKDSNALVQRAIYANDRLPNVLFAHFYFSKDYMVWPPPSTWINEQLAFNLGAEAHHLVQQNPLVLSLLAKFAFYFANFEGDDLGDLSQNIDAAVPKTFGRGHQYKKK